MGGLSSKEPKERMKGTQRVKMIKTLKVTVQVGGGDAAEILEQEALKSESTTPDVTALTICARK